MSLGRHRRRSDDPAPAVPLRAAPRGRFWEQMAAALESEGFDAWLEELARPWFAPRRGRPSIPPGIYFRMRFVATVEGIESQRELAWRCADSLVLRRFLGFSPHDATPDHSTLTLARRRFPGDVHEQAVRELWRIARKHDVMRGRSFPLSAVGGGLPEAARPDDLPQRRVE